MAHVMTPLNWGTGLKSVAADLGTRLLDQEKAVVFNTGFDKNKVEDIILDILNDRVTGLAEAREEALQKYLSEAQNELGQAKDEVEKGKKELLIVEARYVDSIETVKSELTAQLTSVELENQKFDQIIKDLESKIRDMENKHRQALKLREDNFSALEADYKKLEGEKNAVDKRLKEAAEKIREQAQDLVDEKNYGLSANARSDRKNEELKKANRSVQNLNKKNLELEKQVFEVSAKEKQIRREWEESKRTIAKLDKKLSEFTRLRSGSVSVKSSKSNSDVSSVKGLGNLGEELEATEDKEFILELEQEMTELKGEYEYIKLEVEHLKKERDELEEQLKKANDRIDELNQEISRLTPFESQVSDLEDELQKANDELKRLQQRTSGSQSSASTYVTALEFDALNAKFEEEKAELAGKIAKLERDLEQALEDLKTNPTGNEINELRRLLAKAEEDLKAEQDARADLEKTIGDRELELRDQEAKCEQDARLAAEEHQARIDALQAEFESKQNNTNQSRDDLAEYWEELGKKLSARSQELQGLFQKDLALNHTTRDQYTERLKSMKEEINRNPHAPETAVTKRRAAGLEREIERMNGVIRTLSVQASWFQDTLPEFDEGARRAQAAQTEAAVATSEAIAAATAARAQAEAEIAAHNRAAAEARRALWRDGWDGVTGLFWRERWNIIALGNLAVMLALAVTVATLGREVGLWRSANMPVQRGFYVNTLDRPSFCLRQPSWELLWEFLVMLITGSWFWKRNV